MWTLFFFFSYDFFHHINSKLWDINTENRIFCFLLSSVHGGFSVCSTLSCVFKLKPTHLIALFRPDFFYISHLQSLLFLDIMFFATLSVKIAMRINYTLCRLASLHYIHQFCCFLALSVASSDNTLFVLSSGAPFESPMWCYFWGIWEKQSVGLSASCFANAKSVVIQHVLKQLVQSNIQRHPDSIYNHFRCVIMDRMCVSWHFAALIEFTYTPLQKSSKSFGVFFL